MNELEFETTTKILSKKNLVKILYNENDFFRKNAKKTTDSVSVNLTQHGVKDVVLEVRKQSKNIYILRSWTTNKDMQQHLNRACQLIHKALGLKKG